MIEFKDFQKLARLTREVIVSEKIDGTNTQIFIAPGYPDTPGAVDSWLAEDGTDLVMLAGSRTRWITPEDDNHGFAAWVALHREELRTLGPGRHFGEWWGQGIQRKYGLAEKRFSLFNTIRWAVHGMEPAVIETQDPRITKVQDVLPACCGLVPVLYRGVFDTAVIDSELDDLEAAGSRAAPGFMKPEGLVVFHVAANTGFKKTIGGDGHKGAK